VSAPGNPRLERRAGFARWRFGLWRSVRVAQGFSSPPDLSRRCDLQLEIFFSRRVSVPHRRRPDLRFTVPARAE
jgi:hypothetical protein